jgi:hypothetical protein
LLAVLLVGCAAGGRFRRPTDEREFTADVLHRYLDRWVGWQSLTSQIKVTVNAGDTTVSARGNLIYLLGERYQLGFRRPYDRFLGNFYVTPEQTIYWDVHGTPRAYSAHDTVTLAQLLPLQVPDWDPRDLLPFPVSGRSSGLQPDSSWKEGGQLWISAIGNGVSYLLRVSRSTGFVEQEWVSRTGRDPLLKTYRRTKTVNGWPIPMRVVCADTTGRFSMIWSMSGVVLKSQPYSLPPDSLAPRISGEAP